MTREEFIEKFKEGYKITSWGQGSGYALILSIGKERIFVRHYDESGKSGGEELNYFSYDWKLYQEPKKKVKLYQYVIKSGSSGAYFSKSHFYKSEEEALKGQSEGSKVIKVLNEIEVYE